MIQQALQAMLVLSAVGGILAALLLVANRFLANYGPCEIQINDKEPFTVEGGCSLLDALYGERIFIPSACGGQGTCGFCKVGVKSGGGPVLPTELPFLSPAELEDHTRLACQVKVKENMVLKVREDYLSVQEFQAKVVHAELITHDTREIRMELVEPAQIDFKPGQYVQVRVPAKGEPVYRAYSISNPPSQNNVVELLVRLIPGGVGSGYLHEIRVGDEITLTGPYGEFELTETADTELVCVGGGCGMAPMRSILRHVADTWPTRKCSLYFGARTTDDIMYFDEFATLKSQLPNLEIHYALSEPDQSPDWKGETGFIHESVITHMNEEGSRQAFLCGPPPMIDATMKVLDDKQVPSDMVFYDKF